MVFSSLLRCPHGMTGHQFVHPASDTCLTSKTQLFNIWVRDDRSYSRFLKRSALWFCTSSSLRCLHLQSTVSHLSSLCEDGVVAMTKASARDRVFCIFRGEQQRISDSPPDPIKLLSTSVYKWFLSPPDPIKLTFTSSDKRFLISLNLDG
ncbi:hypothetical protein F2Q68_00024632 [Brassica cretica]|uniref:Uncharacterized protein n=1 Tax=Brassica cretica TaxID=69181 RepID=A0A8S9IIF5_BRACR|nr:hypothetical protein F2Q68_00024632 [Brassica cretica]